MRRYCFWCGRYKFLMHGPDGNEVCGFCIEEPEYLDHVHRTGCIDRREARKVTNGHKKPMLPH